MTNDWENIFSEIQSLVEAEAERRITPAQIARLEELVLSDPTAAAIYVNYVYETASIVWPRQAAGATGGEAGEQEAAFITDDEPEYSDAEAFRDSATMILPAIREAPDDAPPKALPSQAAWAPIDARQKPHSLYRWRMAAAAAAVLLAGFAALVIVRMYHSPVATMAQVLEAKWEGGSSGPSSPDLRPGAQLALESGFCRLLFKDGTQLIAEGPAHFTIEARNAVSLTQGTLTARMAGGSSGFIIRTPTATVTDLGTEFGVHVEPNRNETDVQVFQGSVRIATDANNQPHTLNLAAGERADIASEGTIRINPDGAQPQMFVRQIDEPVQLLSIADLVSGGDGTTHRTGGMVEATTGATGKLQVIGAHEGDAAYHRITSLPALDGCFVPTRGEMQIDSGGSRFGFTQPGGIVVGHIVAGGLIPWVASPAPIHGRLGEVDYSLPPHDLLMLHPDCGLTFNLAAIRRLHPFEQLSGFRAVFGNGSSEPKTAKVLPQLQILVDGVLRYEHVITSRQDINKLDVPLTDHDHFVTVAVIRTTPVVHFQTVVLGDPVFVLTNRQRGF